jgi:DNA-binding CsgD family transcriptional regulator
MASRPEHIPISDATAIVAALNRATCSDWSTERQIACLLDELARLLGGRPLCTVALLDGAGADGQCPQILEHYCHGLDDDDTDSHDDDRQPATLDSRRLIRETCPIIQTCLERAAARPESVVTFVTGNDMDPDAWRRTQLYRALLAPLGYNDMIHCAWATCARRVIGTSVYHRAGDPPIDPGQVSLVGLMHRAMAPMIDRQMLSEHSALAGGELTERQREVLRLLLSGDGEKQIADQLRRSVHTVHTHIRQLYEHFGVKSRGELMARFIDRRALGPTPAPSANPPRPRPEAIE